MSYHLTLDPHRKSALADLRTYMPTSGTPDVGARG
jgi:hypothetical protein